MSEFSVNHGLVQYPKIVSHFVAGFPDYKSSLEIARGLVSSGAFALEMQIPFSDPNADGPTIENACRLALESGFKVDDAFRLIKTIRTESDIPIFVMSYASLAIIPGVENFIRQIHAAGANGVIIPDLAPENDEGLYSKAASLKCPAVPVVVPWISDNRLKRILAEPIEWIYVALRSGITGAYTEIGETQSAFLSKLRAQRDKGGPRVMAGFGIQQADQVVQVMKWADAAIVGSALVKRIADVEPLDARQAAEDLLQTLLGKN